MSGPVLHYVYDPLCGWCYAVAPLVEAAERAGIEIVLHGGGLWESATALRPDKRSSIRQSDARIAAMTGMTFGVAYLDGLLASDETVFWSRPTISAVLAAGATRAGADLRMMHAIQHAHYAEGRRVVDRAVLAGVAATVGLEKDAFLHALDASPVDDHIAQTRRWMQDLGLRGFPNFLFERDSELIRVQHEVFLGRPSDFLQAVTALATA